MSHEVIATVNYLCAGCGWRLSQAAGESETLVCENCGRNNGILAPSADATVEKCAVCGCDELYVQKDFNRATGIALVVLGAVFVPWTYGLSLLGVTIVDFALYYRLKSVTVCYGCRSVYRGYGLNPAHNPFDLVVHDRHVYGAAPPGAEEAHRP